MTVHEKLDYLMSNGTGANNYKLYYATYPGWCDSSDGVTHTIDLSITISNYSELTRSNFVGFGISNISGMGIHTDSGNIAITSYTPSTGTLEFTCFNIQNPVFLIVTDK